MGPSRHVRLSEIHGARFSADARRQRDGEGALPISRLLGREAAGSPNPSMGSDEAPQEECEQLMRFHQVERELQRDNSLWWSRILHNPTELPRYHEFSITGLMELHRGAVVLQVAEEDVTVIVASQWIKEQRETGRPLRVVHPSLGRAGMTERQVEERLMELLGTEGCRISLYDPIKVGRDMLVARQFTLEFD